MMKKTILLTLLCVVACSCWAKMGTKFSSKDKFGNTLWYEVISENEVMLTMKNMEDSKYLRMVKVSIPSKVSYKEYEYSVTKIDRIVTFAKYSCVNCVNGEEKSALEYVELPSTMSEMCNEGAPCYAFDHCVALKEVILHEGLKTIGYNAFNCCTNLNKIIIPNSVIRIEKYAFANCISLTAINIPNSVTTIQAWAFSDCTSLQKITGLHDGIQISDLAFCNSSINLSQVKQSFDYCANTYILHGIKEWQKKHDFETRSQYQQRVSKDNQKKKVEELLAGAINQYTSRPENRLKVVLDSYDADYEIYKLKTNYGDKFVKVILSDAPSFKKGFSKAVFSPQYIVTKDGLVIGDLTLSVNGTVYRAENTKGLMMSDLSGIALPTIEIPYQEQTAPVAKASQAPVTIDHSIDQNIPTGCANNTNTFAVIIGNEKYQQVMAVPYANNDAKVFAEYCKKTLGLPEKNVRIYENATYGAMIGAVSHIQKIAKAYKGNINVIFYYAGHGIPDEATGDAYLLPIDADGINMRICYPLNQLYKELGNLRVKSVTCFMDCCFSGAERGNGMVVAARGVAIKVKSDQPVGNTVVFTAATDKQTAFPYKEKGHGLFTYYLLKKLRDSKGDCTLGELGSYISDEVAKQAVVTNGKEQTPVVLTAAGMTANWKTMKLK